MWFRYALRATQPPEILLSYSTTGNDKHGLPRRYAPRNDVCGFDTASPTQPPEILLGYSTTGNDKYGLPRRYAPRNDAVVECSRSECIETTFF